MRQDNGDLEMKKQKKCYGIDISRRKYLTSQEVRDAIIECFLEAHDNVLNQIREFSVSASNKDIERMKLLNVQLFIKAKFKEIRGDFNNPTKEDLIKICEKLAEFAENFRGQNTIHEHFKEIMELINMIKE